MNLKMLRYMLGRVIGVFGLILTAPLIISFLYREDVLMHRAWLTPILLCLVVYFFIGRKKPENVTFYAREGLVICAVSWIILSLIGALPLYLSGEYPTIVDGFFEISSGLTTTGASVAKNVDLLKHSTLFWRSLTHLIGGMGVLVFILAFVPHSSSSTVQLAKAEMPGPVFGKIVAKLSDSTRILYLIYFSMTGVLVVFLLFGGMNLFDSLCHAFGTAGTGGFGLHSNSVAYYQSPYIHWVLSIGMLAFSVNFNLYYYLLVKKFSDFYKDEELRFFLIFVLVFIILISLDNFLSYQNQGKGIFTLVTDSSFALSSIISTTGYTTTDFSKWPIFSRTILLLAMMIGGCGGSTAGGFKVSRIALTLKTVRHSLIHIRHPRRVVPLQMSGRTVTNEEKNSIHGYISIYMCMIIILMLIVALDPACDSFETMISTVFATFNNVGPGLGNVVGPLGSYLPLSQFTKIILSIGMIAGRLEIWPILILFSARTWKQV